ALRAETRLQPDGRAEDAAIDAEIFAKQDDIGIILHRAGERQIDGLDQRYLSHRPLPRVGGAARHKPWVDRHKDDRTWFRVGAARLPNSARPPPRRAHGTPQ